MGDPESVAPTPSGMPQRERDGSTGSATNPQRELEEERRRARLVAAFFEDAARTASDDRSVWQARAERATEAIGDSAVASLITEDGEWLEAVGVYHPDPAFSKQIWDAVARRRLDGTMYGDVIRKGSVVFIPTFQREAPGAAAAQMSEDQRRILSRSEVHSIIALPLLLNGKVAGVLATSRTVTPEPYTQADVDVLLALAARAAVVLDNARTHRALRSASERLSTIIKESPIATAFLGADGRVQMWNRAAEALVGWAPAEVEGRDLPTMPPDRAADEGELTQRLLAGEVVRGRESRILHRDGHEIPVALYAAPLHEDGTIAGTVLRWVDLSERHNLEAQLQQAQRLESVGRLAGGIAHDFNNILTAILGFAQLVDEDMAPDDPRRTNIRSIEESAERATSLVRQLLAFGRQQVLRLEVVDLGEVLERIGPMLQRLIGEDVSVALKHPDGLWLVEADRSQLEQVIVNLAVNARDAMPRGGTLTIEVSNVDLDARYASTHPEVEPGPHVLLAVSDTGVGMDPETMSHIFEPFFTTKEAGRGTGLGLSTVYGIVRQSGGHIWVYSELDRGTTFRLYFPRASGAIAEAPGAEAETVPVTGTETILVAEDEEILRALIEVILRRLGYTVVLARNAAEALEIARQRHVDLLLTDVVMPGQSGIELAAAVREKSPGTRVLMMSGYTSAALEPHGMMEGDELLQKPFTPDSLARAVRSRLARGD